MNDYCVYFNFSSSEAIFDLFIYIPFRHLNKINSQKRKERSYNRCKFTFLHTLTCYFQMK
jgi:hypothetical protein